MKLDKAKKLKCCHFKECIAFISLNKFFNFLNYVEKNTV